ncbi:hypothetical protein MOF38_17410 [Bacillus haynesii]|uniref:hypothetical protein n=1 Tax=Bacillus haynesii TaxID=1925021 RepID=UPI00227F9F9B|nr:hypothetical protein [Bacillus haynesii]MCY9401552.1 hypothetical protein [Bacillus haynesii]
MKFKKSVVSALSISALALSMGGVASAKEVDNSTIPISEAKQASFLVQDKISIQNFDLYMDPGGTYDIRKYNPLAASWKTNNKYVADVNANGIIHANNTGDATITLYKSNGSLLGAIYVHVR